MAEHLEVLGVMAGGRIGLIEAVGEADPFDGGLGDASDGVGRIDPQGVEHRRDKVDGVGVLGADLPPGFDAPGPRDDAGVGAAAPVGFTLPSPERGISGVGPTPGVVVEDVDSSQLVDVGQILLQRFGGIVEEQHLVDGADRTAFCAGSIVGDQQDEGVVEFADLLQEVHHPAKVMIGEGQEAGKDLHHPGIELLFL